MEFGKHIGTGLWGLADKALPVLYGLGFVVLVYWLAAAADGPDRYAGAVALLGSLPLQLVRFGVVFAFCYHLLNGVRVCSQGFTDAYCA